MKFKVQSSKWGKQDGGALHFRSALLEAGISSKPRKKIDQIDQRDENS